jgi:hypothetical protein
MNKETIAKLKSPRCGMPDLSQTNSDPRIAQYKTSKC